MLARRPVGSAFTAPRGVPLTWRLFRGATAYSATRLRFPPTCRDKRWIGSDGGKGEASSVRSRAARIRDFEGPGAAIVAEARREMPHVALLSIN